MTAESDEPGEPDLLDGHLAWQMLSLAITELTGLVAIENDPFPATSAASAHHRVFSVTPGAREYLGRMGPDDNDGDERDVINIKEEVAIKLWHDLDPHSHPNSHEVASADLDALENAILTHPKAFRILQPELIGSRPKREGHTLVHTLDIIITYGRLLPPMLE